MLNSKGCSNFVTTKKQQVDPEEVKHHKRNKNEIDGSLNKFSESPIHLLWFLESFVLPNQEGVQTYYPIHMSPLRPHNGVQRQGKYIWQPPFGSEFCSPSSPIKQLGSLMWEKTIYPVLPRLESPLLMYKKERQFHKRAEFSSTSQSRRTSCINEWRKSLLVNGACTVTMDLHQLEGSKSVNCEGDYLMRIVSFIYLRKLWRNNQDATACRIV